jgi:hypothetical protein
VDKLGIPRWSTDLKVARASNGPDAGEAVGALIAIPGDAARVGG